MGTEAAGARVRAESARRGRFRRPSLRIGQPRKLTPEEAAALAARPWPKLPWWLWAAVVVGLVGLVVASIGLLSQPEQGLPRVGERRTAPAGGLTHDLAGWRAPALMSAGGEIVWATATCPRLAGLALAGTADQVALLQRASDQVCALRSVGGIDAARTGLREARAVVTFATFERSGNESATLVEAPSGQGVDLGDARVAVLLNAKFVLGGQDEAARRVAVLLVHEGAHLAGGPSAPTAEAELAARRAEAEACERLFPAGQDGPRPNRGCEDARELLRLGDAGALAELRRSGYR